MPRKVVRSDDEWRKLLTPQQYAVTRFKATEQAFTGAYWESHEAGTYCCVGCAEPLFTSEDKFDTETGWPSFLRPASSEAVDTAADFSHLIHRTEVLCRSCGAHLGHVFDDGPKPTGQRYCINSAALVLKATTPERRT